MKKITKAVIPAAGYGTRFLPFTKIMPKEMLPIVDTPTIELIVREAISSGITDVLIIINRDKDIIKTHFGHNLSLEKFLENKNKKEELEIIKELPKLVNVSFIYQDEMKGLGHAVNLAKDFVNDEPFLLLLGDDLYVSDKDPASLQLIKAYEKTSSSILGTLVVPDNDVSKYGICSPINKNSKERLLELESVVEKPDLKDAPSNLAIGGRYILTPTIFEYLQTQKPGKGGEIQLTDSILRLKEKEKIYSYELDAKRYDIGSKKGFLEATIDFALNRDDLKDDIKRIINERKI